MRHIESWLEETYPGAGSGRPHAVLPSAIVTQFRAAEAPSGAIQGDVTHVADRIAAWVAAAGGKKRSKLNPLAGMLILLPRLAEAPAAHVRDWAHEHRADVDALTDVLARMASAGFMGFTDVGVSSVVGDVELELERASRVLADLKQLDWSGVSDRQWKDALGVIAVQRDALDLDYLRRWARDLGLEDLLERALVEGLFPKDRLLSYIRDFVAFEVANEAIAKKGAKYHQFFAVRMT